jgi:DNA mismatch repair protein MSH2
MHLNSTVSKALDLFSEDSTSLFKLLNKCSTAQGKCKLESWLKVPLTDLNEINERLDRVEYFYNNSELRLSLQSKLKCVKDLSKTMHKFESFAQGSKSAASLEDCVSVYQFTRTLQQIDGLLIDSQYYKEEVHECAQPLDKLIELVEKAIDLQRFESEKNYFVNPRFDDTLQQIDTKSRQVDAEIEDLRKSLMLKLNLSKEIKLIPSNSQLYLFECNKKDIDQAMRNFPSVELKIVTHKANTVSFTCADLKYLTSAKKSLQEEYITYQEDLAYKVIGLVGTYTSLIFKIDSILSHLDVILSFAYVSTVPVVPYTRPAIFINGNLKLVKSRHPTLEHISSCIPNDIEMIRNHKTFHLITGPNMGGKTTFLRQVAIICIMAHIGCFVPCEYAEVPLLDAVFARVGAGDQQLKGISTFMSEMLEVSHLLENSSRNSLIIIDELGRGTSTSEGLGIAWAVAEELANRGTFTIFATHFHELTEINHPAIENYHTDVSFCQGNLQMLYKVLQGAMDASYGIEIAKLAGLPDSLIRTAELMKEELEGNHSHSEVYNFLMQRDSFGTECLIEAYSLL